MEHAAPKGHRWGFCACGERLRWLRAKLRTLARSACIGRKRPYFFPGCVRPEFSGEHERTDGGWFTATSKNMSTLRETFLAELSTVYSGETHLLKNMGKLAEAASDPELKEAIETHQAETGDQVKRLEELFRELDISPKRKKCRAMEALVEEANDIGGEGDVGILAAAQRIEHYEIACYQSLIAWARALEEEEALGVLEEILEEEELTNDKLTEIADTTVIPDASNSDKGEEDEEEQETT